MQATTKAGLTSHLKMALPVDNRNASSLEASLGIERIKDLRRWPWNFLQRCVQGLGRLPFEPAHHVMHALSSTMCSLHWCAQGTSCNACTASVGSKYKALIARILTEVVVDEVVQIDSLEKKLLAIQPRSTVDCHHTKRLRPKVPCQCAESLG